MHALQPFGFFVHHITGEENVGEAKLSRIPWRMAVPSVVKIVQLAGQIELHTEAGEESKSGSEEEGEDGFEEDSVAHGEVLLLGIEMLREDGKGDTDCQSLAQWVSATARTTRDELQASSLYLPLLAKHLERIAEEDQ